MSLFSNWAQTCLEWGLHMSSHPPVRSVPPALFRPSPLGFAAECFGRVAPCSQYRDGCLAATARYRAFDSEHGGRIATRYVRSP